MRPPTTLLRARAPRPQARRAASTSATSAAQVAQKTAQQAWARAKTLLGPVGERAGSLLGSYRAPLLYNLALARELAKQVYLAERLAPPALHTVQAAYGTLWGRAASAEYWRGLVRSGEWKQVGVYAVEAYGIFKIGEILGRRSLVGYDLH